MGYKVEHDFVDTNSHHYKKGDVYPAEGFSLDNDRAEFLLTEHPKYQRAFLSDKNATKKEEAKAKAKAEAEAKAIAEAEAKSSAENEKAEEAKTSKSKAAEK